jgi:methyl-accepting chemotaxis protein
MKLRLTISRAMMLFGAAIILGLGAVITTSHLALNELKVGGPLYGKIKLGNDLIADILPPPEYVIEAYLEATLALLRPAEVGSRAERMVQLRKDYDDRREFWQKSDLVPALRNKLTETSHAHVARFWAASDAMFAALRAGDTAAAERAYGDATAAYAGHRAVIDDIVKQASDDNAATEASATASVSSYGWVLWSVSGAVGLMICLGIAGVGLGVIRPITAITALMQRLASGDLDIEVPAARRADEIGAMAQAVQVFKDDARRVRDMEAERAAVAGRLDGERRAAMHQVADGFEQAVGEIVRSLTDSSAEIETAAESLAGAAATTLSLSDSAGHASEQSSDHVRAAAAASAQMAASVQEIGRRVQESHAVAGAAVQQAQATDARIALLSQAGERIGEVVKMISAVADQTNLLALNATIEAARAGDAGRGFAVVATEVKALAAQTAKATEEISTQIEQMQSATQESVAAIREIGGTIARISEISSAIAAAVEEQGTATAEIARSVQQAAEGASTASGSIQEVRRGAATTGAASHQVHGRAQALLAGSRHLSDEVGRFLNRIRAG